MKRLMPEPGDYKMPVMRMARVTGTDSADFIQLIFEAETEAAGQTEKLSMAVPISALDATGLLRSLRILQEKGLIPFVPEGNPQAKN